jgi:CDP-diacylglycerol--serine O-phosphatidyltransferase
MLHFLVVVIVVVVTILNYEWMPSLLFIAYLIYGFVRPFISRQWRREIEEDEDDDNQEPQTPSQTP